MNETNQMNQTNHKTKRTAFLSILRGRVLLSQTYRPPRSCSVEMVFPQPANAPCRTCITGSPLKDPHLFVPERFDWIEPSGLVGRIQSEEQADHE